MRYYINVSENKNGEFLFRTDLDDNLDRVKRTYDLIKSSNKDVKVCVYSTPDMTYTEIKSFT